MLKRLTLLIYLMLIPSLGNTASLLISTTPDGLPNFQSNYGYGNYYWGGMTDLIDAEHNVTTTNDFSDINTMLMHDAIILDQRGLSALLGDVEVDNITTYISTGRKVIMYGENGNWTNWNNQILGIVGGSYRGHILEEVLHPITSNGLTADANNVMFRYFGTAYGGEALFNQNVMSLWGDNVLTILDITVFEDGIYGFGSGYDNYQLATNVVNWIDEPAPVPLPGAIWLLGAAIAGLTAFRKRAG